MIRSVWHTSWTVSDLDRSIAFYRDLLGFELLRSYVRTGTFIETVVPACLATVARHRCSRLASA